MKTTISVPDDVRLFIDLANAQLNDAKACDFAGLVPAFERLACRARRGAEELLLAELAELHERPHYHAEGWDTNQLLSDAHSNIILRATIWRPLCKEKERHSFEAKLFSYHHAHNYNVHFLNVGHFGPGYDTDIVEYDRTALAGHIGEPVMLRHAGRTRLSVGKIMAYRADRDIHTQFPRESVSVSLNLVVASDDSGTLSVSNRQEHFDPAFLQLV